MTVAVFVIVPGVVGVTTIVTVSLAPEAMVPRSQLITVPAWVQLSAESDGVAEISVTPAGKVSVSVTAEAALGPALPTTNV